MPWVRSRAQWREGMCSAFNKPFSKVSTFNQELTLGAQFRVRQDSRTRLHHGEEGGHASPISGRGYDGKLLFDGIVRQLGPSVAVWAVEIDLLTQNVKLLAVNGQSLQGGGGCLLHSFG